MLVPRWLPKHTRGKGFSLAGVVLGGTALVAPNNAFTASMHRDNTHVIVVGRPTSERDPLTYLSDTESYAKNGLITWSGNVRVWQGDHAIRADQITYDRNTGILSADGHVAIIEPDGSTTYANHMEFSHGMRDGIGSAIFMRMEDNAKLAGTGIRRTNGLINDLSHAVYTACQICERNPDAPPFWQFQAYNATQDVEHKRVEFDHAWLKMMGIPVFYFPFFSMPDPSIKRQSGFLMPGIGPHDRYLGTYVTIPYFWAIDKTQDLTVRALIATKTAPELTAEYRKRFNFGQVDVTGGVAYDTLHEKSTDTNAFGLPQSNKGEHGLQGFLFAKSDFALNENWHTGTNINVASSANYMRDYRISGYGQETLQSNIFLEGYGVGSYARFDADAYQGLNQGTIKNSDLPWALPRFTYTFQGQPDALGGRFSLQTTDFNLYRPNGVSDQRGQVQMQWDRPFSNKLGQQWLLTARLNSNIYNASSLESQPTYYTVHRRFTGQVLPTIALKMNWPFLRSFAKGHGTQIFEPIVQAIAAPNTGNSVNRYMPNEDSFAYEFSDSTLFALNRYMGTDRLDGGVRGNIGIHQNWSWNGHSIDMLFGESIQQHITHNRIPFSGLDHHLSDPIGRIRFNPNRYLDVTARGRYNPWRKRFDYGEGVIGAGVPLFHVTGGYIYEPVTPYYYYSGNYRPNIPSWNPYWKEISELTAGFSTQWRNYHASAFIRRSLSRKEQVATGGTIGYSNDCFGLDLIVIDQNTRIGGQRRYSTVLMNFTFKTIGTFGINL
ncbi:LPS-assembly protein LptD [Swingsia samuiensis]|uniref:LPS-assembly protein LptD n=1 Tax=Swingsia samuiensis TaxID=1293412 RepID=A0A4Y6UIX0_9PROT|nr:LPS assembly protein LptD [Swingsia samuiensis]QDH16416.1 LPS-assembly protein LptD [Swingsia samuiensis]